MFRTNLNFDTDSIRKNNIELLDCQVDLVLRSLEFYCYTYQYIYPRHGKSESKEENLRIGLIRDTYEQISSEFSNSKKENPLIPIDSLFNEKFFKKSA